MSPEELKQALIDERRVLVRTLVNGDIECDHVSGIIYRKDKQGFIRVSGECRNKEGFSVIVARAEDIVSK